MNHVSVTIHGCMARIEQGSLIINRRKIKDVAKSLIDLSATNNEAMEHACSIPQGRWSAAAWFPEGEAEDIDSFMTWNILIEPQLVDIVMASCQTRLLAKEPPKKSDREVTLGHTF